jgi:hypothetical protein
MNANEGISHEQDATVRRIGLYIRNWWRWVRARLLIHDMKNNYKFRAHSLSGLSISNCEAWIPSAGTVTPFITTVASASIRFLE